MTKTTRRAFLSSVVALVICLTMLIGTTFAWFTDTASTAVNTIQSGVLKVDIVDANGNSLEGTTLSFTDYYGNTNILWEPGVTFTTPNFKIVNKGNLALKYEVVLTGMQGDAKLAEAIEWTYKVDGAEADITAERTLNKFGTGNNISISAHMKETAGNEYQGLSIDNIAITVVATQYTSEWDSTTNQYDKDATYSNGTNVISGDAVLNGTYIALDHNGDDPTSNVMHALRITSGDVTITGGYYDGGNGGSHTAVCVDAGANLTIKGGYFTVGDDAEHDGNNVILANGGNITIEGGTFYTEYTYNNRYYILNAKDNSGGHITVKGGKFYRFDPSQASINGSDFYVGSREIEVADGYKVVQNGDWYYVVPNDATVVNTAADLIDAAANGGNICVTSDITLEGLVTLADSTNLYLYDHTIARPGVSPNRTALYVNNADATVNIYGDGEVSAYSVAVWCANGTVNIYGGNYTACQGVYVTDNGVANIYGGTFKSENPVDGSDFVLNQKDGDRATTEINVYGGTFIDFNPADNVAEGEGTNFVANGYHVVTNGNTYTVVAD